MSIVVMALSMLLGVAAPAENLTNTIDMAKKAMSNQVVSVEINDFNDSAAREFEKQIFAANQTGQSLVVVTIDSYGGSVYSLMRMIDTIQNSKIPVATVCKGKCMSCGAMLFAMGHEGMRFAGKNATILLHQVSSMAQGKVDEMKIDVAEGDRLNKLIFSLISRNTGHKEDFFWNLVKSKGNIDLYISVDEAAKLNIVNKVKYPELKVIFDVKYVLE